MNGELYDSGLWCRQLVRWLGDRDMFTDCGRSAIAFHVKGSAVIMRCHSHPLFEPGWEFLDLDSYMVRQVMES